MIVVDSSALIAILQREAEAEHFLSAIRNASRCLASAVSIYETGIVTRARRGPGGLVDFMRFVDELDIEIIPFAEPYISRALEAYARYGKGLNPSTRLNLGDCAAYALAKALEAPLLFKGGDFPMTDVIKHP